MSSIVDLEQTLGWLSRSVGGVTKQQHPRQPKLRQRASLISSNSLARGPLSLLKVPAAKAGFYLGYRVIPEGPTL
ncbi:MAG: hypothetical protein M3Q09_07995 [Gemmatimonadota bacterium]|nr:hypothetical protein [Gemmatimonadota bacterium]